MKLDENLKKPINVLLLLIIALALWIILHFIDIDYNIFYFDTNDILGNNLYIVAAILFYMILITVIRIIYLLAKKYFINRKQVK
jgi:fumarate reductase subunit D